MKNIEKTSKIIVIAFCTLIIIGLVASVGAQVLVSSDVVRGSRIDVTVALYKDNTELDPNYDYYLVKASVFDKFGGYMDSLNLEIWLPSYAQEVPNQHIPRDGVNYNTNPVSFSVSYSAIGSGVGMGVSVKTPTNQISYSFNQGHAIWNVQRLFFGGTVADSRIAEFAVAVRIPQNQPCYVWTGATAKWVAFLGGFLAFPFPFPNGSDSAYWAYASYSQ